MRPPLDTPAVTEDFEQPINSTGYLGAFSPGFAERLIRIFRHFFGYSIMSTENGTKMKINVVLLNLAKAVTVPSVGSDATALFRMSTLKKLKVLITERRFHRYTTF